MNEGCNPEAREELTGLKKTAISSSNVRELPPAKLAAVLAAYLVSYDDTICDKFARMKGSLGRFFKKNSFPELCY